MDSSPRSISPKDYLCQLTYDPTTLAELLEIRGGDQQISTGIAEVTNIGTYL